MEPSLNIAEKREQKKEGAEAGQSLDYVSDSLALQRMYQPEQACEKGYPENCCPILLIRPDEREQSRSKEEEHEAV